MILPAQRRLCLGTAKQQSTIRRWIIVLNLKTGIVLTKSMAMAVWRIVDA